MAASQSRVEHRQNEYRPAVHIRQGSSNIAALSLSLSSHCVMHVFYKWTLQLKVRLAGFNLVA